MATEILIDTNIINKAKKRIGSRNANIIAELLEVKNFDEKHLRACCPFHKEDTPSWIYNPKQYNFHCFGCGRNTDILDAYMTKGFTYISAVQKLFEEADIKYSFGELGVKTVSDYRYPKEVECNEKSKIYDYLGLRKISRETIDVCDVRQDGHGNIVFNYYDTNDVLTLVKYRPSHKINKSKGEVKTWCQKDADTKPLLFNMNRINTSEPLLICEGEIDALSAIEVGYTNAVSVPFGAGNFQWIECNWDWLEQFESIVVCADNDESGNKMVKEVTSRLGNWRTKVVQLPEFYESENGKRKVSDLNETLFRFGKEFTLKTLLDAKDSPVDSVIDFCDIEDIDLSTIDGIYTGIEALDSELMKLFYGTVTILTGTNGSGKSSLLSQFICQSLDQNKPVWLYSKELPNSMMKNWINFVLAGRRNISAFTDKKGAKYYRVTPQARKAIDDYYRNRLYVYKDDYSNGVEDIKKSMEASVRKYGCKMLIIDNLTVINLGGNDINKNEVQNEFMSWLTKFAATFQVVVVLVIHPRKGQQLVRLCKYDIGGSGGMLDLAHRSFALYRVQPKDKVSKGSSPPQTHDVILDVLKDRLRGRENLSVEMYYDKPSRRFYTNEDEFSYQYKWDNTHYTDRIPYPHPDETNEVLGEEVTVEQ